MHRWTTWVFALALAAGCTEPPGEATAAQTSVEAPRLREVDALPDTDQDRVLELTAPYRDLPAGTRVLEVVDVERGFVVLGADHALAWHHDGQVEPVDADVAPPISARGQTLAYARGEMPFQAIVVTPLGATPVAWTEGDAAAWNPALGPDGDVVFVSGRDGVPALYRARGPGQVERLVLPGAFPASLTAPTHDGTALRFEDERGVAHTVALRPAQ